jgi:eukaryotic-like serine/threonine-protein kinase
MHVEPGTVLDGKFRIVRKLGEGGMGVVMAADHLQLRSQVAIKLLKREASDKRLERFMREARALAQLQTEHVTRVYDVGTLSSGEPYIVMELLVGEDLSTMLRRGGALPVRDAVDYAVQAMVGLSEAHGIGIVHRDIKPANLFLASLRDGRRIVKVLDFGISKVNEIAKGQGPALTDTGAMLGSPHYMSPEQLRSTREVDVRADVWSLGVTIYRLVTGQYAFEAQSVAEIAIEVLTKPPPMLRQVMPQAPLALEQALSRCMEQAPEQRFQSLPELAVALAPLGSTDAAQALERIRAGLAARGLALPDPPRATVPADVPTQTVQPIAPTVDDPHSPASHSRASYSRVSYSRVSHSGAPHSGVSHPHAGPSPGHLAHSHQGSLAYPQATASPPRRARWPWVVGGLLGVGTLAAGAVAIGMAADGADGARDRPTTSSGDDGGAKSADGKGTRVALKSSRPYYDQAPVIAAAVRRAHGKTLRVYDILIFEDRARFVVESKDDGLVRYEVEASRISDAAPHKLPSTSRLDNLLLDLKVLDLKVVQRIAADAPRRLGKSSARAYSVSLHRVSQGVVWAVALKTGESARYNLAGQPVK